VAKIAEPIGGRREQILHVALDLFGAHGIEHVTTRQIAQAVGISQPSLYAHFRSLDEIAVELCCRAFDLLYDRARAAADGTTDAERRLYDIGREYIRFGLEHSAAYRVAFMIEPTNQTAEQKARALAAGHRAFGVLLDACAAARESDDATTHALAQSMWASVHGLVALLLAREHFPWVEREALIETHLRRVCRLDD
jgi:AcrR family transcriptional regulator